MLFECTRGWVIGSGLGRELAADLVGVWGVALWDQRSTCLRLPTEEGVMGR